MNLPGKIIHFFTHDLWCRTCNPFVQMPSDHPAMGSVGHQALKDLTDHQRRVQFAKIRDMLEIDARVEAARDRRRMELRIALEGTDAKPWEIDLLLDIVERYRASATQLIAQRPRP